MNGVAKNNNKFDKFFSIDLTVQQKMKIHFKNTVNQI